MATWMHSLAEFLGKSVPDEVEESSSMHIASGNDRSTQNPKDNETSVHESEQCGAITAWACTDEK